RIQTLQLVVDPLGARADGRALGAAAGARPREAARRAAVMAAQLAGRGMDGDALVAARTLLHLAARRAEQRRRESAPVEKEQHLTAVLEVAVDGIEQRCLQALLRRMLSEFDDTTARSA